MPEKKVSEIPLGATVRKHFEVLLISKLTASEEKELIRQVPATYSPNGEILVQPMLNHLNALGYSTLNSNISYENHQDKIFIYLGNCPLDPNVSIPT